MNLLNVVIARLKEKSTWAGIATIAAAIGWKMEPEAWSAIAAAVISAVGVYEVFRKEK